MTTKSALCFMRLIPAVSRDALHSTEHRYGPGDRAHSPETPCVPERWGWDVGLLVPNTWLDTGFKRCLWEQKVLLAVKERKHLTQNTEIKKAGSFFVTLCTAQVLRT